MEDFDRSRITRSLIREASAPTDLAQKIAEEVEERLAKLGTLYLTAPLIREFVNVVLIEKGLQEYRHKLTRLGLPVYDVTQLIEEAGRSNLNVETVQERAGASIMKEYTLLNVLPREIADAHLSGDIHISNEGTWVVKPYEVYHDTRVFLRDGVRFDPSGIPAFNFGPPKDMVEALSVTSLVFKICGSECSGEQMVDHFNVILAPYMRTSTRDQVKRSIRLFLLDLNRTPSQNGLPCKLTLGLDFHIPSHLGEAKVEGAAGENAPLRDFEDQARSLLDTILDVILETAEETPFLNPCLVFNVTSEDLRDSSSGSLMLKAHKLAAKGVQCAYANQTRRWQTYASYMASGTRLTADWLKDWELDTVRCGCLDSVTINMPRVAYDAKGNDGKFNEILSKRFALAADTLQIKHHTMEERFRQRLLPFLSQPVNGDLYFRLGNSTSAISFIGLDEAVRSHTGHRIGEDRNSASFALRLIKRVVSETAELGRKNGIRLTLSQTPADDASTRLAELDVEKYGWAVARTHGSRELPHYSDTVIVPLEEKIAVKDRLAIEAAFHPLTTGGHISTILLEEPEQAPEKLMASTKHICENSDLGYFAYNRDLSYCGNCHTTFGGVIAKCPKCASSGALIHYSRQTSRVKPFGWWPNAKRRSLPERVRYVI
jgi:ribonucleoside-triphosphate reductase